MGSYCRREVQANGGDIDELRYAGGQVSGLATGVAGWRGRWIGAQRWVFRRASGLGGEGRRGPAHLETGLRGEAEALFELRRHGYIVVARRWRSAKLRGDVDLIAWDGDWLCFVEVKTRSSRGIVPAEFAVDDDKKQMLRRLARVYVHGFEAERRRSVKVRFDVVAVYLVGDGVAFDIYKGAFGRDG